jgi:hypothetical protein
MSCNSHRRTTRRRMRFLQSVYVQLLYIIRVSCDVLYKFCRMCFWQKHIYMFKDHIYLLFYSHSGARGGHAGAVMPGAVMPRAVMPGAVKPGAVMPGAVTPCKDAHFVVHLTAAECYVQVKFTSKQEFFFLRVYI